MHGYHMHDRTRSRLENGDKLCVALIFLFFLFFSLLLPPSRDSQQAMKYCLMPGLFGVTPLSSPNTCDPVPLSGPYPPMMPLGARAVQSRPIMAIGSRTDEPHPMTDPRSL